MQHNETDFKALMAQYEQELMQLRRQAVPAAPPPDSSPAPLSAAPPEASAHFQGNLSQEQPPADSTDAPAFSAALQVRVTAAHEALPIPNALVTVRREPTDTAADKQVRLTGISGLTDPLSLPATNPALTLQPAAAVPLVTYEITVSAPGYYRVRSSGIPLYGGIAAVQPVSLIPLPEWGALHDVEQSFPIPRIPL